MINLIVWNLQQVGTLDKLVVQGCQWVKDYLKNNPNLEKGDRQLCESDFTIKGWDRGLLGLLGQGDF